MSEQFAALINEPAGFVTEAAPDDKEGEEIGIEIISATSEKQAISRIDEESGDPIGFETIEFFGEFPGFLEEIFRDSVLLLYGNIFNSGPAFASQGVVEFQVFRIKEADPCCEIGSVLVVSAKDSSCIELCQGIEVALFGKSDQFFRNLHNKDTGWMDQKSR